MSSRDAPPTQEGLPETTAARPGVIELMRRAVSFHRASLFDQAAAAYNQITALDPHHADALHLLGVLLHQKGDHAGAVAMIGRAIAIEDTDPAFHANLGIALKACGRPDEAISAYRHAIALAPEFPEAHNNLGIVLFQQGDVEASLRHYHLALAHREDYADAFYNLAVALRSNGEPERAIEAFQRALDLNPKNRDAYLGLARTLVAFGRLDEAETSYRRQLAAFPKDIEAIRSAGDLLVSMGRSADAIAVYAAGLECSPQDPELLNNLGVAFIATERFAEAGVALAACIAASPDYADAHYNAGAILEKTGRLEEAISAYRTAINLRPTHPQAHRALGALYTALDRREEAGRIYRHWHSVSPDHPVARHMAASLAQAEAPSRASNDYIKDVFAPFALTFDRVLERLHYRVPKLMAALLERFVGAHPCDIVDVGCGTGLCAPFLKPYARRLSGVDLSSEMLAKAAERDLYDALVEAELTDFLGCHPAAFDLVAAADTLVYFGDLAPPLDAAAHALREGGLMLCNLESGDLEGHRLNDQGRFAHSRAYVERAAAAAGFSVLALETAVIREQANRPVGGYLVVLGK